MILQWPGHGDKEKAGSASALIPDVQADDFVEAEKRLLKGVG